MADVGERAGPVAPSAGKWTPSTIVSTDVTANGAARDDGRVVAEPAHDARVVDARSTCSSASISASSRTGRAAQRWR